MVNKGRTFQRKSSIQLSFKEMLMNSLLWSFVRLAEIEHVHTYELRNIIRIQVNKGRLHIIFTMFDTFAPHLARKLLHQFDLTKCCINHFTDFLIATADPVSSDADPMKDFFSEYKINISKTELTQRICSTGIIYYYYACFICTVSRQSASSYAWKHP